MKLVIYVIAMCLLLAAGPASAEWFADAYAGQSFTLKDDMSVHSPSGLSIYQDTEFDRAFIIGGRFGRYLDAVPFLGFGVDLSTWRSPLAARAVTCRKESTRISRGGIPAVPRIKVGGILVGGYFSGGYFIF